MEEFEALHDAWEKLTDKREIKTVFLTWEWLYAWWKTHHAGKELWLITAWRRDELVGIAPLMLSIEKKYRIKSRLLQSLGAPNTDESDFLAIDDDPDIITSLCEYILKNKKYWDAIKLHEFRSTLASTQMVRDELAKGKLYISIQNSNHNYIPIRGAWEDYFKSLSKNMRQNLERRLRRIKETHALSFEFHKGQSLQWKQFEIIFEVNKNGNFPEKYESEKERAFHRALLETMGPKGWLEIALIFIDGKPVSFEYGFNMGGRFEDWRTGYDKNFGKMAVGKLMLYLLLQELFKQGYVMFDFLRGDYEHKQDWRPLQNEFAIVTAVRPTRLFSYITLVAIPLLWKWTKEHLQLRRRSSTSTSASESS